MKKLNHFLVLLVSVLLLATACESGKEPLQQLNPTGNSELTQHEKELFSCEAFFKEEGMQVTDDYIKVEGDIWLSRALLNQPEEPIVSEGVVDRQYALLPGFVVSNTRIVNVRVFNGVPTTSAWFAAVATGLATWTNINNCKVAFTMVTTHAAADVSIFLDDNTTLPAAIRNQGTSWGEACFAQNGVPGRFISLNRSLALTAANRSFVITHEMGHALGFRHADQITNPETANFNDGCGNAIQGLTLLHGTPADDLTSLMVSGPGGGGNPPLAFNAADIRASRLLYPNSLGAPSISNASWTSNSGFGSLWTVTVNASVPTSETYTLQITCVKSNGGTYNFYRTPTPSNTYTIGLQRTGNYTITAKAVNYKGDFSSGNSNTYNLPM